MKYFLLKNFIILCLSLLLYYTKAFCCAEIFQNARLNNNPRNDLIIIPTIKEDITAVKGYLSVVFSNWLKATTKDLSQVDALVFRFEMSLEEAISNAAHHANKDDPTKLITIQIRYNPIEFEVVIKDESGEFFDPKDDNDYRNKARFKSEKELCECEPQITQLRQDLGIDSQRPQGDGGRGIFLMEKLADKIRYFPHVEDSKIIGTAVSLKWFAR